MKLLTLLLSDFSTLEGFGTLRGLTKVESITPLHLPRQNPQKNHQG
jgi:hypothetical protein